MNSEEAKELLPWYAVGALDASQMRAVESLLRENPDLERELKELRALRGQLESNVEEPKFRPELIHDMHRRIDEYERTRAAEAKEPGVVASLNVIVREGFARLIAWNTMPVFAKAAIVGQFALVLALGALLIFRAPAEGSFETASGQGAVPNSASLSVTFTPEATIAQISALLHEIDAEIVSGPLEQTYSLALRDATRTDAALQTLRNRTDVVRLANEIPKN